VQSERNPNYTLYRFEKGNNMMVYYEDGGRINVNYHIIWSFFEDGLGLNYGETQDIMKKWLDEVYNLRGITTQHPIYVFGNSWVRSTI
jgi:hypothetical protein